jgi:hypothetical protein
MPEQNDVNPESSLESAVASSQEAEQQAQETQTPTAEQGVTQEQTPQQTEPQAEEQRVPYDRFKEVNDERAFWRDRYQQDIVQRQQQAPQPQAPQADPYAGKSPEERAFWEEVDRRAEERAKRIVNEQITPQLEAAKLEFARQRISEFHKEHPEIKPGSPEEQMIVEKVRQGYVLDDAYKVVMYEKKLAEKQVASEQQQKQRLEAKKQANVVSPQSVSSQAIPTPKINWEEDFTQRMNKDWNGQL